MSRSAEIGDRRDNCANIIMSDNVVKNTPVTKVSGHLNLVAKEFRGKFFGSFQHVALFDFMCLKFLQFYFLVC